MGSQSHIPSQLHQLHTQISQIRSVTQFFSIEHSKSLSQLTQFPPHSVKLASKKLNFLNFKKKIMKNFPSLNFHLSKSKSYINRTIVKIKEIRKTLTRRFHKTSFISLSYNQGYARQTRPTNMDTITDNVQQVHILYKRFFSYSISKFEFKRGKSICN